MWYYGWHSDKLGIRPLVKVASLLSVKKSNPELLVPTQLKASFKAPVPKRDEKPIMNLVSSKNFVTRPQSRSVLSEC